jgi:hypothetical protein
LSIYEAFAVCGTVLGTKDVNRRGKTLPSQALLDAGKRSASQQTEGCSQLLVVLNVMKMLKWVEIRRDNWEPGTLEYREL